MERPALPTEEELLGCPTPTSLALCEYHATRVGKLHIYIQLNGVVYVPCGRNISLGSTGDGWVEDRGPCAALCVLPSVSEV